MRKITVCHLCGTIWEKRPFICDCRSNVFMKDFDATEEDILKLKQDPKFTFGTFNKTNNVTYVKQI